LVVDFAGNDNPTANELFQRKMRKAVGRNSSEVGRAALTKARVEGIYTKHGIFMGEYVQAPLDSRRFDIVFQRIIRALYLHYTNGDRIPSDYPIEVLRIMPWDAERVWGDFQAFNLNRCGPFGDVFFGACARVEEDVRSTMWLLTFYQRVHFHVKALGYVP